MEKGRRIAILADVHGLLEPLEAILNDINSKNIDAVYSLGDAIGYGPNSAQVLDLLRDRKVICLAGNAEDYITLGVEAFPHIFSFSRLISQEWLEDGLSKEQIDWFGTWPHSIDLTLGGKAISLCHFASDVRFDYIENGVFKYHENYKQGSGAEQFLYTNSKKQLEEMKVAMNSLSYAEKRGYLSALEEPLFGGKTVLSYDAIFQGHLHFKAIEHYKNCLFMSLRAAGMAFLESPLDEAYYIILTENEQGFLVEEEKVVFDREQMEWRIEHSTCPDKRIRKYTGMKY